MYITLEVVNTNHCLANIKRLEKYEAIKNALGDVID